MTRRSGVVPDDWVIETAGTRTLDKARRTRLPRGVRVDVFGTITDDGLTAAFFETLHFCPSCKTSYESSRQSEFSRVSSLGTEGRASAVTVLSQAVVRTLKAETDLDDEARKFLAFSDNRQDTSLQAGHFNDFVSVGMIRSALYRAARDQQEKYPDEPLTDEDLGPRVVKVLGGTPADFAKNPDVEYAAKRKSPAPCAIRLHIGCGRICSGAGASPCRTSSRPASCASRTRVSTSSLPMSRNGRIWASRWPVRNRRPVFSSWGIAR
ncbi:hypothetical protein ACETU7_23155 [Rhodococcus sp. 3Y1]